MKRDVISQSRHPNHTLIRNSMSISTAVSVADCLGFDLAVGVVGVVAVDLAVGLVRCHASPQLLGHPRTSFLLHGRVCDLEIIARAFSSDSSEQESF